MQTPDFNNLLKVLHGEVPSRPTLFELFLNGPLNAKLAGRTHVPDYGSSDWWRMVVAAYAQAGYDYATVAGSNMRFPLKETKRQASLSANDTAIITDRDSFKAYPWPDPDGYDYSRLDTLGTDLPAGMKLIAFGPGGVLENVMFLVGYESLCLMVKDSPGLVEDIFEAVGSRLLRYYTRCAAYETVGALVSNDDWGFSTQTMLRPEDMRRYVFPWHRRIVEAIHRAGKPAILHSCGNLSSIMEEIIEDLGYDGKHSYEDKICPVEQAYEQWGGRIAILGGIDVDFICRATPAQIKDRCTAMLKRTAVRGGYALGTGNSVPEYVPIQNYYAMIESRAEKEYF